MSIADWYPDPTRSGRLRYWDGTAWTEHVSEDGGTASDPIVGIPPAPPGLEPAPPPPPLPPLPGPTPARRAAPYPPTLLGRAGFGVAALGGILMAATVGSTAVEQPAFGSIEVAGGAWIGVVAAVLCIGAAVAPWFWARLAGVGISSFFAIVVAFALIGFRTSDDLAPGVDVSLGGAGWLMLLGSLLLFAGTAMALIWLRVPVREPDAGQAAPEGKAVASLVVGIVGVVLPFAAAPAIGLSMYATDDMKASDGRVGGRGMAIAGLVLGIVSLSIWGLGLLLGMLLAQP